MNAAAWKSSCAAVFGLALGVAMAPAMAKDAKDIKIGYTAYPPDLSVQAEAVAGAKAEAQRLGTTVIFAPSAGAVAQANAVDNLLTAGVDVIAIDPEDSKAIGPSVEKANEAGVPIIMWIGDDLGGGKTATLISSDEEVGGYDIAKWAFEKLGGKGDVGLIQGTKAHQAGLLRENGFRRALAEFPGIKLAEYGEANWEPNRAAALAADMLVRTPDLKVIFTLSDGMAQGAYTSVKSSGASTMVTGYNGDCETLNSIWTGNITAAMYQGWRGIGAQVVRTGLDIAQGKQVPKKVTTPAFVMDKAVMQQVLDNKMPGVSPDVGLDVKRAVDGCK